MRSQAPSANRDKDKKFTGWLSPATVVSVGFCCGVAGALAAKQGGRWILAAAVLVAVTLACDRYYPHVAARVGVASRRGLVFVPLAARVMEAGWLWAMWHLGAPAGVVVSAGALSFLHEYVRARGQIAGLRDIAVSTLGERTTRTVSALAGFGVSGVVALGATPLSQGLVTGLVTFAATAWLLMGILGFVQLLIVLSAALRR